MAASVKDKELADLSEQMQAAVTALRGAHEARIKAAEDGLVGSKSELEAKSAKINGTIDELEKKFNDRLKEIETKSADSQAKAEARAAAIEAKFSAPGPSDVGQVSSGAKKAFLAYASKGDQIAPDTLKVLTIASDPGGGYLAPSEFVAEIIKTTVEFSPVRGLARVRTTSSKESRHPTRTGTYAAQWAGENTTRTETTGLTYGLETIPNHELYAMVDVSNEDLEDSAFNLESELQMEAGEQFGVAEGLAFIGGNGAKKPEGIITSTKVLTETVDDTGGDKVDGDDLIDTYYKIKDIYARNGSWLFNRTTIQGIRALKLGVDSPQYIWAAGLSDGTPSTILGRPYFEATDLSPDGVPSKSVGIFGDFRRGYVISDRIQIAMVRDPLTQANMGNTRFWFRKRVGGQVVLGEALVVLKTQA